ncbi:MAG TPA: hypothetical protein VHO47_02565 [Candidatus Babeliales bacterium]|nr:hypothetical protein [Candidatus Babeliales bacterium]
MKILNMKIVLLVAAICSQTIFAELFIPRSLNEFRSILNSHNLAVVHFNSHEAANDQTKAEDMKRAFLQLSQKPRYKDAMVAFVGVNSSRFPEIGMAYKAAKENGSKLVLFHGGVAIQENDNILTKDEMKDYIERYFGKIIDETIEQNAPARMRPYSAREYYPRSRQIVREYTEPEYYYDDADYYYPRAYGRRYYNDYYGGYYGPGIGFDVGTPLGGFGFGLGF